MAELRIIKKQLTISDLEMLACLHATADSFIRAVCNSPFPLSILEQAGDLETFYFGINGSVMYDPEECDK